MFARTFSVGFDRAAPDHMSIHLDLAMIMCEFHADFFTDIDIAINNQADTESGDIPHFFHMETALTFIQTDFTFLQVCGGKPLMFAMSVVHIGLLRQHRLTRNHYMPIGIFGQFPLDRMAYTASQFTPLRTRNFLSSSIRKIASGASAIMPQDDAGIACVKKIWFRCGI